MSAPSQGFSLISFFEILIHINIIVNSTIEINIPVLLYQIGQIDQNELLYNKQVMVRLLSAEYLKLLLNSNEGLTINSLQYLQDNTLLLCNP